MSENVKTSDKSAFGSSHCSVSIERSCVTKMTLEHIDVRFGNKTAHVSRHKTDDCDYEFSFEAITHHEGSDHVKITEEEKQMIRDELDDWEPLH